MGVNEIGLVLDAVTFILVILLYIGRTRGV